MSRSPLSVVPTARRVLTCAALLALTACTSTADVESGRLRGETPFVAFTRQGQSAKAASLRQALGSGAPELENETFYLALHRKELGQRYFLSAFLKNLWPGLAVTSPLETRVVTFKVQNDKLFIFDVTDGKAVSDTFSPELVVEAFPLVTNHAKFNGTPGAENYVLFDPAAGLNRFSLQALGGSTRFQTDLLFSQRFRATEDGATWEQVFSGTFDEANYENLDFGEGNVFRLWGTLGMSLRRYSEGKGFRPQPMALDQPVRFIPGAALTVPNTSGMRQVLTSKWNIRRGMRPIQWIIGDKVNALQADPRFSGYDIAGAIKAGVESWNEVFGFKVLEARAATPDDSEGEDDKNVIVVDTSPVLPVAWAASRTNPNTGEIRGSTIYLSAVFLYGANRYFSDDSGAQATTTGIVLEKPVQALKVRWDSLPTQSLCELSAMGHDGVDRIDAKRMQALVGGPLSKKDKVERYLQHVITHEIGHTLGLMHNFKGSLLPPSSSVMDYTPQEERVATHVPQAYDIDAIRYLYGMSPNLPPQPFCSGSEPYQGLPDDPECATFDRGARPLDHWKALYGAMVGAYLTGSAPPPSAGRAPSSLARFVVSGATAEIRNEAYDALVGPVRPPVASASLAAPGAAERADALASELYTSAFAAPLAIDPAIAARVVEDVRGIVVNADGIRSFESRRAAVDSLKSYQTVAAYEALVSAKDALVASKASLQGQTLILTEDLVRKIEAALSPYFETK